MFLVILGVACRPQGLRQSPSKQDTPPLSITQVIDRSDVHNKVGIYHSPVLSIPLFA